jgi:hypothetical protein
MHCKKGYRFSPPQPGIFKLFPARKGLVCDIPAGEGKNENLSLQCAIRESSPFWKFT